MIVLSVHVTRVSETADIRNKFIPITVCMYVYKARGFVRISRENGWTEFDETAQNRVHNVTRPTWSTAVSIFSQFQDDGRLYEVTTTESQVFHVFNDLVLIDLEI